MSSKKKKSDGRSGELEKAEEVFQAVILTDSFNFRFLPITLETPRVSELQITFSSQLIFFFVFFCFKIKFSLNKFIKLFI